MAWYYLDSEGNEVGPLSPSEMKNLVQENIVQRTTSVRSDYLSTYTPAENDPVLFPGQLPQHETSTESPQIPQKTSKQVLAKDLFPFLWMASQAEIAAGGIFVVIGIFRYLGGCFGELDKSSDAMVEMARKIALLLSGGSFFTSGLIMFASGAIILILLEIFATLKTNSR